MVRLDNLNTAPDYDTFILWIKSYSFLVLNVSFGQMGTEHIFTNEAEKLNSIACKYEP